jgi:hypothetical protein
MSNVSELRSSDRFGALEPLAGGFGSASVTILDLAPRGVQIEHSQPLRLSLNGRLWFRRDDVAVSVQGRVVWSHLSSARDANGKLLYHSGIHVPEEAGELAGAIARLERHGVLRKDEESLERKRTTAEERNQQRAARPAVKFVRHGHEVDADTALLILQARDRLRANPAESIKWYNRAKFAIIDSGSPVATDQLRHREEALAVWEYLERSIDIALIERVFTRGR